MCGQLSSCIRFRESLRRFVASSKFAQESMRFQSNASSLCCKASFRCSLTSPKDTYRLSGLAGWLAETMTERWSDRTRLLNVTGVFHRCELLVRNTSKILSPRVDLVTNCFKLCWEIKSLMLRWLMSPAIMMRAFGSLAKMSSQVSVRWAKRSESA